MRIKENKTKEEGQILIKVQWYLPNFMWNGFAWSLVKFSPLLINTVSSTYFLKRFSAHPTTRGDHIGSVSLVIEERD